MGHNMNFRNLALWGLPALAIAGAAYAWLGSGRTPPAAADTDAPVVRDMRTVDTKTPTKPVRPGHLASASAPAASRPIRKPTPHAAPSTRPPKYGRREIKQKEVKLMPAG